jgi:cysteine desulfurase
MSTIASNSRAAPETSPIRIVLVEPSHPGNIGAVARAMKNMALSELVLVRPKLFPHPEATARASGADDLLARARVTSSVAEALEGCGFVAATTSRERDQNFRVLDLRDAAERVVQEAHRAPAAVLFGAERTGLTNEGLEASHVLIRIPANPEYASLNLAMAVQLVTYELYRARGAYVKPQATLGPPGTPEEMSRLYVHFEQVLNEIDFRDRTQSGTHLMTRIRRFLQRAELDHNEVNILRGILTAVQQRRRVAGAARQTSQKLGQATGIYLDYAATTPVDSAVAQAMQDCLTQNGDFGNASSTTHAYGKRASEHVEVARQKVAKLIGADPQEIVFTSGATESNNLVLLGLARANADRGRHIITSRTEHKAVLDPCKRLEKEGFAVTYLTPDRTGRIDVRALEAALRRDTVLVSIMHANNEIGVLQDIEAIGALCRNREIAFHTDAAQSAGKSDLDVQKLNVDFVSFTAHKLYGPKGIGALYVRKTARHLLQPILFGGGQEHGLRPGTLPVSQIAGFGAACEIATNTRVNELERIRSLRDRLWDGLKSLQAVHLNGEGAPRIDGILNVSFEGVEGESLITALPSLAVSTSAACSSASDEPSYVLRALGRATQLAESSLRFSLGRFTTPEEIDTAIEKVRGAVLRLRAVSPREWDGGRAERSSDAVHNERGGAASWSSGVGKPRAAPIQGDVLSPLAREYFESLPAAGSIAGQSMTYGGSDVRLGEAGAEGRETWIRFYVLIADDTVKDARFQAYGCPHTLAVASWLAAQLPGRRRADALPGGPFEWARVLQVPTEKLGRLLVVEDAVRAALAEG